jgi:hypothetical protein
MSLSSGPFFPPSDAQLKILKKRLYGDGTTSTEAAREAGVSEPQELISSGRKPRFGQRLKELAADLVVSEAKSA